MTTNRVRNKMNENLQIAVAQILEKAISGIDSGVAFMQAELPDVIEQLMMWHVVKGAVNSLIGIILIIPIFVFLKEMRKQDIQSATSDSFWVNYEEYGRNKIGKMAEINCAVFLCAATAGFFVFFGNIYDPIQIWIAPKVWLMEYAASMVK